MPRRGTHYERAFESYLQERQIPYVAVDQAKKAVFAGAKIKSFDFILYPRQGPKILADVKGRKVASREEEAPKAGPPATTSLAYKPGKRSSAPPTSPHSSLHTGLPITYQKSMISMILFSRNHQRMLYFPVVYSKNAKQTQFPTLILMRK